MPDTNLTHNTKAEVIWTILPILILILTALGLVTPRTLIGIRRWAIVVSLIVCEIITPGDAVISTLILWVPVYGLYELSIVISWFVERAKKKAEEVVASAVTTVDQIIANKERDILEV